MTNRSLKFDALILRDAIPGDEAFLKDLFAATRTDELTALAWDPEQASLFIESQFRIQQQNYQSRYPHAQNRIILLAGEPIGRILVDRGPGIIALVDIALLEGHRRRGIGSALIADLLSEADAARKLVRLSVFKLNPAIRLYERLGFCRTADDGVYVEMHRQPAPV